MSTSRTSPLPSSNLALHIEQVFPSGTPIPAEERAAQLRLLGEEAKQAVTIGKEQLRRKLQLTIDQRQKALEEAQANSTPKGEANRLIEESLEKVLGRLIADKKGPFLQLVKGFELLTSRPVEARAVFTLAGVLLKDEDVISVPVQQVSHEQWLELVQADHIGVNIRIPSVTCKADASIDQIQAMRDDLKHGRVVSVNVISQKVAPPADLVKLINKLDVDQKEIAKLTAAVMAAKKDYADKMAQAEDSSLTLSSNILASTASGASMLAAVEEMMENISNGRNLPVIEG